MELDAIDAETKSVAIGYSSNIDMKIVKASFKDCALEDRKKFSQSSCLLPISVGQSVHEEKKFLATLKLIDRSFKKCTILIDDSVQRHTMKIKDLSSDVIVTQRALEEGKAWLNRNINLINMLSIPYEIITWDKWLYHEDFITKYKEIENEYHRNDEFKFSLDANVDDYLIRNSSKDIDFYIYGKDRARELCVDYLKEECAAMCLWVQGGYDYEVYPTGRNLAMQATYTYIIKPSFPNLLKSVSLRFKKY